MCIPSNRRNLDPWAGIRLADSIESRPPHTQTDSRPRSQSLAMACPQPLSLPPHPHPRPQSPPATPRRRLSRPSPLRPKPAEDEDAAATAMDLSASLHNVATALVALASGPMAAAAPAAEASLASVPPKKRHKLMSARPNAAGKNIQAIFKLPPKASGQLQQLPVFQWGLWRDRVLPFVTPTDLARLSHVSGQYRDLHTR